MSETQHISNYKDTTVELTETNYFLEAGTQRAHVKIITVKCEDLQSRLHVSWKHFN